MTGASDVKEPGPARVIATLALAGLCSGVAIVGIYLITLPRIRQNQAEALLLAVDHVLDIARTDEAGDPLLVFENKRAFVVKDGGLVPWSGDLSAGLPAEEAVYAGYDGERLVGFAVPAEAPGFQDAIKLIYGYDPTGDRLLGLQVLESRETPGLGDKIIKDQGWLAQFRGLPLSGFDQELAGVKPGKGTQPWEVDVISGATISSKAVLKAVNRANARWLPQLRAVAKGKTP